MSLQYKNEERPKSQQNINSPLSLRSISSSVLIFFLSMFHSNYKHRVQYSPKSMGKIVGVGFRPTEQELVDFYLKHKLLADDSRVDVIPVIDLCHVEPSDVPGNLEKIELPNIPFVIYILLLFMSLLCECDPFVVSNRDTCKITDSIR